MVHIEVTGPVPDLNWWKQLTGLYLRETLGQEFSIHCWKDEEQEAPARTRATLLGEPRATEYAK